MPRAVLADPNRLLGWPKVAEAARLPGRGVEPRATNLRVRNCFGVPHLRRGSKLLRVVKEERGSASAGPPV